MTSHRRGILFSRNPSYGYFAGSPVEVVAAVTANIAKQKPKHKNSFRAFSNIVIDSIGIESGKDVSNLYYIMDKDASTIPKQVAIFKLLKKKANAYNAPKTANAVQTVAAWYYYNVENPSAASSSSSPSASAPPTPFYEESFFEKHKMPIFGVGVATALYFIFMN